MSVEFADGSKIETTEHGSTFFEGPTAIDLMRITVLKSTLEMDLKGIKMVRGNILTAAERIAGVKFGRGVKGRQAAIVWCEGRIAEIRGEGVVS